MPSHAASGSSSSTSPAQVPQFVLLLPRYMNTWTVQNWSHDVGHIETNFLRGLHPH